MYVLIIGGNKNLQIGDANTESFKDIWFEEKYCLDF